MSIIEQLKKILPEICARETSANPELWNKDNPLLGHCVVVSLLVQEYYGGVLLRISLEHVPGFEKMKSHYFNKLPDNTIVDLTLEQFQGKLSASLIPEERAREYILSYPDTLKRYELLKTRLNQKLK